MATLADWYELAMIWVFTRTMPPYPLAQIAYHAIPLLLLPALVLGFALAARPRAFPAVLALAAFALAAGLFHYLTGNWAVLGSQNWRYLALGLWVAAALAALRGAEWRMIWTPRDVLPLGVGLAGLVLVLPVLITVMTLQRMPGGTVDVGWPFAEGRYRIAGGQDNPWMNHHDAPAERYARDITRLGGWAGPGRQVVLRSNTDSHIFGTPILSPCGGTIIESQSGIPDHAPYDFPESGGLGNFLFIDCGGVVIVLAHMRQGTVELGVGEPVRRGEPVGEVGNSGFSMTPHLHIHALRPPLGDDGREMRDAPYANWTAVPLSFDGPFPVSNDSVRAGQ